MSRSLTRFLPGIVTGGLYDPVVEIVRWQGSGDLQAAARANCYVVVPPDREFIADLEDSLDRNYKRWSAVRSGLGDAGGALDNEVERQLTRVAKLMCQDLTSILDFLREMHKAELEDHYSRYRYICARLHAAP